MRADALLLTRKELEFILNLCEVPYRKKCIYQGVTNEGVEIKLFAIEHENFAYIEQFDPYEGGIHGYFFTEINAQNLYDLQHWFVLPNREVNVLDMGRVRSTVNSSESNGGPADNV